MTYQEIYQAVEDLLGDSSADTELRIKKYINWAQQDVSSRKDWNFLHTSATLATVNGTKNYSLSANCFKLIDMVNATDSTYLEEMDQRTFNQIKPVVSTGDTGAPTTYVPLWNDQSGATVVQLYPTPADAYTLNYNYLKSIPDLASNSDVPIIPNRYHAVLIDYALGREYEHRRSSMANYHLTKYEDGIIKMYNDYELTDKIDRMKGPRGVRIGRDLRF